MNVRGLTSQILTLSPWDHAMRAKCIDEDEDDAELLKHAPTAMLFKIPHGQCEKMMIHALVGVYLIHPYKFHVLET